MKEERRTGSFFLRCADRLGNFLGRACSDSRILGAFSKGYARLDGSLRRSLLLSSVTERERVWRPSSVSRICLVGAENSLFLRLLQGFGRLLLQSTVNSWGIFFLTYGGFSIIRTYLVGEAFSYWWDFLFYLILVVLSVPLLVSERPLKRILAKSVLLAPIYDLCGFSREDTEGTSTGRAHPVAASLWALGLVLLRQVLPWIYPLPMALGLLLVACVFYLPEVLLVSLLAVFPFLSLLPHPTYLLLGGLLLLDGAWLWKAICGKRQLRFGVIESLLLLLVLSFLLSSFGTVGGRATLLHGVTFSFLLLSYFPLKSMLSGALWRRRSLVALQIGGIACSLLGIWQYFFGSLELRWVDVSRFSDLGGRVTASFSNPNLLSVYLLLLLPLALSGMTSGEHSWRMRVFFGVAFLGEALCLILTFTRGAWLGALAALFLWTLLSSARTRGTVILFSPQIFLLASSLPTPVLHRFGSITRLADSSTRYRLYTWQGVRRMIGAHPFGIGSGEAAFVKAYPFYAISGIESVMHAHSLYLQILLELGWGGLLIFLGLLLALALYVFEGCFWRGIDAKNGILGAACGLLGALTMGLFDYIWYHPGLFFLFWAVVALLCSYEEQERFRGRIMR